jgi:predicted acetylornithine/succinylornithine family transaminase
MRDTPDISRNDQPDPTPTAHDQGPFLATYRRIPLEIVRGEGVELIARDGRRYLDMFAGLAVNALGYGHPRVLAAITEQISRYIHLSNYYTQDPQVELAELMTTHTGFPRLFFANSGTETTEGALKLARLRGAARGRTTVLALGGGFHGRTYGALSLMDRPKYRDGFGPFLPGCVVVPADDHETLMHASGSETAAVLFEAVQGEGGIRPLSPGVMDALRRLQEERGILLIADEVQSGLGRTGAFFGYEHFGLRPDMVTVAKPLGGGLPLGAILMTEDVASAMRPGLHGTTFGGNPVACAAGLATLREILEEDLIGNAARVGNHLLASLRSLQQEVPRLVREVRGYGLMVGMELTTPGDDVVSRMREEGILINCTDTTVLRFLPPLIIRREHVDHTCAVLRKVLHKIQ